MAENWEAMQVFLMCGTQWRRAGMAGVPVGLDYAAVRVVCAARRIRLGAALLAKLRDIEAGAIAAFAAQADSAGQSGAP